MAAVAVAIFFLVMLGRDLLGGRHSPFGAWPGFRRLCTVRLGIDLDGVVADFNSGWVTRYNEDFGTDLPLDAIRAWDGIPSLTHFRDMGEFWRWARDHGGHSHFRHLETYPGAVEPLSASAPQGHEVVILTSKPNWAVPDTFAWIADHRIPTREVHIRRTNGGCPATSIWTTLPMWCGASTRPGRRRPCRFVRPWNSPVPGTVDIPGWEAFEAVVRRRR